jgi:hypothetical protein
MAPPPYIESEVERAAGKEMDSDNRDLSI